MKTARQAANQFYNFHNVIMDNMHIDEITVSVTDDDNKRLVNSVKYTNAYVARNFIRSAFVSGGASFVHVEYKTDMGKFEWFALFEQE